ncbi:MAG: PH domain-containing protein [Patescibacteria group bacterium]
MIVVGKPQHLGNKTLVLFLSRRTTLGFIAFIISGVIAFVGPSLSVGVAGLLAFGGSPNMATISQVSSAISTLDVMLFLLSIIAGMVGAIIALLEYRNYMFELDDLSLKINRGIINQYETSVPYHQIHDVSVVRTFAHQLFGTSRLVLITTVHDDASKDRSADTVFDPIDASLAEDIRSFLEHRIGVQVIQQQVSSVPPLAQAQTENHA